MIRQFLIAFGFLTRLPWGGIQCTAEDVGRSSRWFPLVGGLLGAIYIGIAKFLGPFFPPLVIAVLVVVADVLLTGALHFDGLADTADGFGGGRTREDVLRIMRDHAVGSYGASALFLAFALKIAALSALVGSSRAIPSLLLAPAVARWAAVFSSATSAYARSAQEDGSQNAGSPIRFIGRVELIVATFITIPFAVPSPLRGAVIWPGAVIWLLVAAATVVWTALCRRRIGGVTGDTLGATIETAECLVLLAFTINVHVDNFHISEFFRLH